MKVNLRKVREMAGGRSLCRMDPTLKGTISMVRGMEEVPCIMLMEQAIRENLLMVTSMAQGLRCLVMAVGMSGIGS